ncbi:kinase-like protein [Trametes coccinea BRFM310]|uniref:non-specific serine/threonine protein kinase n=2 Tax=Trametes coccinea (strain BRFM310) TaxID=1353009 RepID=A0A1Y2IEY6_TRAC3|nr:kinase-like protein [Trametes coccinea BRFM310]
MKPFSSLSAFLVSASICLAEVLSLRPSGSDLSPHVNPVGHVFPGNEDLELLDIVLVASVDGKLHALNRTSGRPLWSMASSSGTAPTPAAFGPLVRTEHPDLDPDVTDDDDPTQEIYVVEPQSGEIYVMSSPDSPLQRLPFSMPQLVEMSPFSFSGDEDRRVFVGKKETSLLLIELETGRIKATVDSECPWEPFEDIAKSSDQVDLDELESTDDVEEPSATNEVFIGRTDYHISIHTRPTRPSAGRPHVQKLTFSTYGPNKQDHGLQSIYHRTADNTYIQSLPTGKIISFKTASSDPSEASSAARPLWYKEYSNPIVATFDVLRSPKRSQPFVLLQPQPRLQDIFPSVDLTDAAKHNQLPNLDAAYVGLVEESGSLFAMSPDRFPLVVFGDANLDSPRSRRMLDPPPGTVYDYPADKDFPPDVDGVRRIAKERKLRELCRNGGSSDIRCLTGVRKLGSDSQSRISRLLDGAPAVAPPPPSFNDNVAWVPPAQGRNISDGVETPLREDTSNASMRPPIGWDGLPQGSPRDAATSPHKLLGMSPQTQAFSAFALCTIALLLWVSVRKFFGATVSPASATPPNTITVSATKVDGKASPDATTVETALTENGTPNGLTNGNGHANPGESHDDLPTPASEHPPPQAKKVLFAPEALEPSPAIVTAVDGGSHASEGDDTEKEGDVQDTPGKSRSRVRRKRGKKGKGNVTIAVPTNELEQVLGEEAGKAGASVLQPNGTADQQEAQPSIVLAPSPPVSSTPTLVVSDNVLGMGSHGTVVFKGSLQGRAVAVKRMLADFVTLASREVNVLQESDDHPNVIRYYYQEAHANFLYIALELCPASLADIIEHPDQFRDIVVAFDPKRALRQITSGLRHLHALKIIHRDIKPQNILISYAKKGVGENAGHRMLISDFGLCKKLEYDQTSFLPTAHGSMAAGTVGWRAPEILRGEVKLDDAGSDESQSSRGSVGTPTPGTPMGKPTRLTKSVDIFALGCLYYYVLTNGLHPFGDRYEREFNILKNAKNLEGLERFGEEGAEGVDLITRMLSPEAYDRPDTTTASCLLHPYSEQGACSFRHQARREWVRRRASAPLVRIERGSTCIMPVRARRQPLTVRGSAMASSVRRRAHSPTGSEDQRRY